MSKKTYLNLSQREPRLNIFSTINNMKKIGGRYNSFLNNSSERRRLSHTDKTTNIAMKNVVCNFSIVTVVLLLSFVRTRSNTRCRDNCTNELRKRAKFLEELRIRSERWLLLNLWSVSRLSVFMCPFSSPSLSLSLSVSA